jgi:hypothetical protein
MVPLAHARAAAAVLPDARLEVFEGAGHFPHCDDPIRFTDVLLDFLDTTEAARLDPDDYATRLAAQVVDPDTFQEQQRASRTDGVSLREVLSR